MSQRIPQIPPYPRATFRLQLSSTLTFDDAVEIIPDLAAMGFSHLYASPVLAARAGSTHGYDIVDHNTLNPEFGGEEGFQRMVETLHRHEMGLILDFVPNHMGVGYADNEWWLNVLEWGSHSPYVSFFDIDWHSSEQTLRGKVLLPVLGRPYGEILESGELTLAVDRHTGGFSVHYYEHRFPISPYHYAELLSSAADLGSGETANELQRLSLAFRELTRGRSVATQAPTIRRAGELRRAVVTLMTSDSAADAAIEGMCNGLNGTIGDPRTFDRLHRLLERQAYRLAYWRLAANEINYRRFFDINDLAAIRMERPEVFEITHELILRLVGEGAVQGLRLDHVDGLLDPKQYLQRLQEAAAYRLIRRRGPAWQSREATLDQPLYVVVEKILAGHEELREDWPVSGTTGYEHMALVGEVLTHPESEEPLTAAYEQFVGKPRAYEELIRNAKYRTMQETLASELNVLANRMSRLAKRHRRTRDLSRLGLRTALMDIVANFPVYRSYADDTGVSDADRRDIEWAVARARRAARTVDTTAYDFVQSVLTTDLVSDYPGQFRKRDVVELARKIQQFTAPVMAKSVEDTAYYRDARFIARNEVGAEPDRLFASVQAFHYAVIKRHDNHPFGMITTSTHDHKRGEDVRARLAVISEVPDLWRDWTARMAEYASVFATDREDGPAPSRNDQYLLLQTIIGAWPFELAPPDYPGIDSFRERIVEYAVKAAREAKLETSWSRPDEEYERALDRFISAIFSDRRSSTMLRIIGEMVATLSLPGVMNSLSQKLLTLTVPGVPDHYQGTDGWDFSLVDPDNRRPVDFALRREWIRRSDESPETRCGRILREWQTGEIKHATVVAALQLRRELPDLFAAGTYLPLDTTGKFADHLIAFARTFNDETVIVVTPRLTANLMEGARAPLVPPDRWGDTEISIPRTISGKFSDRICGVMVKSREDGENTRIAVADLLTRFPVALLRRIPDGG
jgi:(1->4)-alpha-D-glucan 1-alpha-D-glucosylmutase